MTDLSTSTVFLRSLRAVRRLAPKNIPEDVLLDILQTARWTGSSKNTQPWHLIVVRERATLETVATCGPLAPPLRLMRRVRESTRARPRPGTSAREERGSPEC